METRKLRLGSLRDQSIEAINQVVLNFIQLIGWSTIQLAFLKCDMKESLIGYIA